MTDVLKPSSFNEFTQSRPDLNPDQALAAWEETLVAHRDAISGILGISIDELHGLGVLPSEQAITTITVENS